MLNPGSDYGRDFPAAEVARLLAGDFGASHNTVTVTEPAKVLLSQLLPHPVALTEVLKPVFAAQASVEAAYLAQADFQNGDKHPVTCSSLPTTCCWRATMNADVQLDLKRALADRGLVDFVPYQGGPFDDYFSDVAPFYRRAAARTGWRRWLSGS